MGDITSKTVYLNVLFPSEYRYYFELVNNVETSILIDHPFRLYFPQTTMVEWVLPVGTSGVYLTLGSIPEFMPFGPLNIKIYIPQSMYDAIIIAFLNPINSLDDLVPLIDGNACGVVEFVLLSMDTGEQIKIDLLNTSYVPEVPVTIETLQWKEVLYDVIGLFPDPPILPPLGFPSFRSAVWGLGVFGDVSWNIDISSLDVTTGSSIIGFAYTVSGDLGITFIDPRYCFLREWITFPAEWTTAIKDFAGV